MAMVREEFLFGKFRLLQQKKVSNIGFNHKIVELRKETQLHPCACMCMCSCLRVREYVFFCNFNMWNIAVHVYFKYCFGSFSAQEDAYIVERLFASSLVAIVNQQHPRKLKVCHFKKGTEICNYSYAGSILSCKLNRQVLKHDVIVSIVLLNNWNWIE